MSTRRSDTYAALLEQGVLATLPITETTSSGGLLAACFNELGERHASLPFHVTIGPYTMLPTEFEDGVEAIEQLSDVDPVCAVFTVSDGHFFVDAADFEREVSAFDPQMTAALLEHMRRSTHMSFNAFTPGSALNYSDIIMFNDDRRSWWEEKRHEAAFDLGISNKKLTGLQLRKYIRTNGIRTPGQISRILGRHHHSVTQIEALPSLKTLARRARKSPPRVRDTIEGIIGHLRVLARVGEALAAMQTADEHVLRQAFSTDMINPGIIVETTGDDQLVRETLNDAWELAVQTSGFAPNFTLILDETAASAQRFADVFALLTTATQSVTALCKLLDPDLETE